MSDLKNELKSIAVEVNDLLDKYITIHDAVFKFSWRKIIPLPFIFKAIDFNSLHIQAKQILSELEACNQRIDTLIENTTQKERRFARCLSEYCMALIETVSLLKEILYQLYLKGESSNKYSLSEYNKQCALYKDAISNYTSMGNQLNELYQELYGGSKPDGTIQYRDKDGRLKEKWIPPEALDNMLKSGGAKRVYRILIKDPMHDHVQEDFWELTQEQIDKYWITYHTCAERLKELRQKYLQQIKVPIAKALATVKYSRWVYNTCLVEGWDHAQMTEKEFNWVKKRVWESALFIVNCLLESSPHHPQQEQLKRTQQALCRILQLYDEEKGQYFPEKLNLEKIPRSNIELLLNNKDKMRWRDVHFEQLEIDSDLVMKCARQLLAE